MANTTEQALNQQEVLEDQLYELAVQNSASANEIGVYMRRAQVVKFALELMEQTRAITAASAEAQPSQEPVRWIRLTDAAPPKGKRVWCLREWTPGHIGSDGKPRREVRMAIRNSDEPPTFNDDPSRNCWWHDDDGLNWSDSTTHAWAAIAYPDPQPSAPVAQEGWKLVPVEPTDAMIDAAMEVETHRDDYGHPFYLSYGEAKDAWAKMIAAAPEGEQKNV